MKLKTILVENREQEDFLDTINSGEYIIPKNFLYRGFRKKRNKTFGISKIRKDRKPRNTSSIMDNLAEAARAYYKPSLPSRRTSAFATTTKGYAEQFGHVHYVFPPTSANFACWKNDTTMLYLRGSHQDFEGDYSQNSILNSYKNRYPKVFTFLELWDSKKIGAIEKHLTQHFETVFLNLEDLYYNLNKRLDIEIDKGDLFSRPDAKQLLGITSDFLGILKLLRKTKNYVDDAYEYAPSSPKRIGEILIEADHLLAVNKQWFDSNFMVESNEVVKQ